jgi:hypothetical protein
MTGEFFFLVLFWPIFSIFQFFQKSQFFITFQKNQKKTPIFRNFTDFQLFLVIF